MKDCHKLVGEVEVFYCATVCAGLPNCRLKHPIQLNYAYTKPDGIYWSPVPKPEKPSKNMKSEEGMLLWTKYEADKKAFEDGLTVKYEDQLAIKVLIEHRDMSYPFTRQPIPPPGTCLPIDVKGEVVEQWLCKDVWLDVVEDRQFKPHTSKFQYRLVFRITK